MKIREALFASGNAHKLEEIRRLWPGVGMRGLREFPGYGEPVEDGDTFLANARIKAEAGWAHVRATGAVDACLADDSGLVVDALGGAPGVRSARYAGVGASSADLCAKLLREMGGVTDRRARFECVLVLKGRDFRVEVSGTVEGRIAVEWDGRGGFGYDPVFLPDGFDLTFQAMDGSAKDALSHRGRAMAALLARLGS